MSEEKIHLRHCILYEFQKGNNTMEAVKNLCDVFGEAAITVRTCQRWFMKFRRGDFSVKDEPRSGRPSDVNDDVLREMIKANPSLTSLDVANKFGIHQTTALDNIKRLIKDGKADNVDNKRRHNKIPSSIKKVKKKASSE